MSFKNMTIKTKLIGSLLIAALVPMLIIALISINNAGQALEKSAYEKLTAIQKIKLSQIETFFGERLGDAEVLADNPNTAEAILEIFEANTIAKTKGLSGRDLFKDSGYKQAFDKYNDVFTNYMNTYGYYDIFLIDPTDGDVFYTVELEPDFGTELSRENTHLSKLWKRALQEREPVLSDMEAYAPSNGVPAMFVACPVEYFGDIIGVVAMQISLEAINSIMQQRDGMGETGETYLVGSDKLMRSDSYLDPTGHSVAASLSGNVSRNGVDTKAAREGIAGMESIEVIEDYNGNLVLSVYSPLLLDDGAIKWVCIAEIDEAEVNLPIVALRNQTIIIAVILGLIFAALAYILARSIQKGVTEVIDQITKLVENIVNGKLDSRGDHEKVSIDFQGIIKQLNELINAFVEPLNVVAEYVDRISKGDLPEQITDEYKGDFNELKNNLNQCIDSINGLVAEAAMLAEASVAGKLDTRGDASKFGGDYAKIVKGINNTLDAVVGPITEAAEVMSATANKDLSKRVTGDYKGQLGEFKDDINTAVNNLDEALSQVTEAVDQVSSASTQITSGSQSLAEGANEQASSLEEVSSSLEEMSSMTQQNADNADQAQNLSKEARASADKGNKAMENMKEAIDKIKTSSGETAKIIKTIDEIAFQTNLLALNAAVEAARAGDAGKGFAVVAEEVRNLAQRSADAAKNTAEMIEESVANADGGVKITDEVAATLVEVVDGIGKVNDLVGEIAAASKEQAGGIEQVNTAVAQMNKLTQQNAANSEESASAAEELNGQSRELNALVGEFKLSGNGSSKKQKIRVAPVAKATVQKPQAIKVDKSKGNDKPKKAFKVAKPEAVIPLDDKELSDF